MAMTVAVLIKLDLEVCLISSSSKEIRDKKFAFVDCRMCLCVSVHPPMDQGVTGL